MRPRWSDADLLVERDGARVAVWRDGERLLTAQGVTGSADEGPESWGEVPPGGSNSDVTGAIAWAAGAGPDGAPVLLGAGPSWTTARASGCWIASGLAAEAPAEWEIRGRRRPAQFGHG